MLPIRIMTAAAITALTFTLAPALAGPCEREGDCGAANPSSPLALNQFMKQKRPAKTVQSAPEKPAVAKPVPTFSISAEREHPSVAPTAVAEVSEPETGVRTIETNGVAVTSPDELNEIDALAGEVKVVAADELSEIDLASTPMAAAPDQSAQALQSLASADLPDKDIAWIGKLLLAFSGTIAAASVVRMLIA